MAFRMPFHRNQMLTPLSPSMPVCLPAVPDAIPPLPMTPPDPAEGPITSSKPDSSAIKLALHVISTERAALANLETLYQTDPSAQAGLSKALTQITKSERQGGKLVIVGVGKSGKIGKKLVATFNSLGIHATFLHPTEALHGDLGVIKSHDTVLMITFSGRTPELLVLLPYISPSIPLIVLTSHVVSTTCPLLNDRANSILLPAPIHESEKISFGLSAPTTSTTVALALGDGLALAVAEELHTLPGKGPAEIFQSYHPGGAIGGAASPSDKSTIRMTDISTKVDLVPIATAQDGSKIRSLDVLLAAVRSPGGWVRVSPAHILAPRRIQSLRDMTEAINDYEDRSIVVEKPDWISVLGNCPVDEARQWILKMRSEPRGRTFLRRGTILGIVDNFNEVSGVVEIEDVVGYDLD